MSEEAAYRYAKQLTRSIGITFYVVRSRAGSVMLVQVPSDDCEILATVRPPSSDSGQSIYRAMAVPNAFRHGRLTPVWSATLRVDR